MSEVRVSVSDALPDESVLIHHLVGEYVYALGVTPHELTERLHAQNNWLIDELMQECDGTPKIPKLALLHATLRYADEMSYEQQIALIARFQSALNEHFGVVVDG